MLEMGMWKVGERNRLMRWIEKNLNERGLTDDADSRPALPHRRASVSSNLPPPEVVRTVPRRRGQNQVTISGAGVEEVSGIYEVSGEWDGVGKYSKSCFWKGKHVDFLLFRCRLMNNTKRWFISVVPMNSNPGTNLDTDFYSSPMVQDFADIPPEGGWCICQSGVAPPPSLECDFEMSLASDESLADSTSAMAESVSRQSQPATTSLVARPPPPPSQQLMNQKVMIENAGTSMMIAAPPPPPSEQLMNQKVMIENAGTSMINGVYTPIGIFDGAMVYKKGINWEGRRQTITLFRCIVRGNQKQWYISFVPEGSEPGTSFDTDYYTAAVSADKPDLPPRRGWTEAEEGAAPPPQLVYLTIHQITDAGDEHPNAGSVSSATLAGTTQSSVQLDQAVRPGRKRLRVQGASLSFINGTYSPSGTFDGVPKYKKYVMYKGLDRKLTMFRCLVKGNKKRWYISIVPSGSTPGTIHDTDFYTSPARSLLDLVPPKDGWVVVGKGRGQPPTVDVDRDEESYDTPVCQEEVGERTAEESKDDETRLSDDGERVQITPKASGNLKTLRWNPLGILYSKDSKLRLSQSGINVEGLELPTVVTLNGEHVREGEEEM